MPLPTDFDLKAQEAALRRPEVASALCEELVSRGARRVMLLGLPAAMEEPFLKVPLARAGVMVLVPPAEQRPWLAQVIGQERASNATDGEAEARLRALVAEGAEHGVDQLVVASAELARIVRRAHVGLPVIDALRAGSGRIRHVAFDMGGVLLRWDPLAIARTACTSDEDARLLADAIFASQEWALLDAGAVDEDVVARAARLRVPQRLHAAVEQLVFHWHEDATFLPETGALVRELKEAGYGTYLLSNAGHAFELYQRRLPAYECLDGMVVSYREHVVKPDARIYRILCERYNLEPGACLFVDDMERNVAGARRVGMQGWRFDGSVAGLRYCLCGK